MPTHWYRRKTFVRRVEGLEFGSYRWCCGCSLLNSPHTRTKYLSTASWFSFPDYTCVLDSTLKLLLLNTFSSVNTDSRITNWVCSYLSEIEQYTVLGGNCFAFSRTQGVPKKLFFSQFLCIIWHLQKTLLLGIQMISLYTHRFLPLHIPLQWMSSCLSLNNGLTLNPSTC